MHPQYSPCLLYTSRDYFNLGQECEAKVVTIEREDRKMSLSIKQLTDDPWSIVAAKMCIRDRCPEVTYRLLLPIWGVTTIWYPCFSCSARKKFCNLSLSCVPFGNQIGRPWPTFSENIKSSSSAPSFLWSLFLASSSNSRYSVRSFACLLYTSRCV